MEKREKILGQVHSLLAFQQAMGVDNIPMLANKHEQGAKMTKKEKIKALAELEKSLSDCSRCRLCEQATNLVFGVGNPNSKLMFVGEGPGRDEDKQGEPFVGRAGKLLNKIIEAMNYKREDIYIGNIVKHRPPENRAPASNEMETCMPFLLQQIDIIKPKVIVCLGATAVQGLLNTEEKIGQLRGKFVSWNGINVMPTYHPAFLLRNPKMKKPVWEDMQKVIDFLK